MKTLSRLLVVATAVQLGSMTGPPRAASFDAGNAGSSTSPVTKSQSGSRRGAASAPTVRIRYEQPFIKVKPGFEGEETPIDGPTTITQPGSYMVTSDFAANPEDECIAITIASDDVTLDLRGHTLIGGVLVTASGDGTLVVRGGTISGGCETPEAGLDAARHSGGGPSSEGGLRMTGQLGEVRVEGMTVIGGLLGISVAAREVTVADCRVSSFETAIRALDYQVGHFTGNRLVADDYPGLVLNGSHGEVLDNTVDTRYFSAEFGGAFNVIRGNAFSGDSDEGGITLSTDDSEFSYNTVVGGDTGVAVHGERNVIAYNTIKQSKSCGIDFFGHVDDNQYHDNLFIDVGADVCGVP